MESLFLQSPDTITVLCTVGVLLVFYVLFSSFANRHIKEPLGPWPLPVIGNCIFYVKVGLTFYTFFFFFVMAFISAFKEVWTSIYIPLVVVFAGHKTIKQALVHHDAFSETEVPQIIQDLKLTHGILFANGPVNNSVSNIICSIVYGNRFEYDDPIFTSMVERATQNSKLLGCPSMQLYNFFPRLFSWLGVRKQLVQSAFVNLSNMKTLIKDLQDTLNPGMCRGSGFLSGPQDPESGNMNSHYHDDNLLVTVSNLFSTGTDTTSSSIRYGLLLMAKNPTIQGKEHNNLDMNRVVGSRQVWVEDRKNLPYTDAVIHEIQRMSITIPMILHRTTRDVTFQDYFIKKDGHFKKRDAFIPFSAARACAGESLARMELFLFFTSLLQHFSFTPPPGVKEDELNLTQNVGITLSPSPHKRCAISRV
uniref:Uncharacterized protein n=1 Tax=Labrus bergylta TaxID=56723 RepID=A0A3Q3GFQ7_9LABR